MTNQEAIDFNKNLKMYMKISDKSNPCKFLEENYVALDMAIKALEQEQYYKDLAESYEKTINKLTKAIAEQEPKTDGDCISRQAAEEITWEEPSYTDALNVLTEVREKIRRLPSVKPQEPKTKWIPCSERLPEEEGLYLVSVKNEHDRRYSKTCWFHGDGNWFARQDVEAWMPLPKAYEEE